MRKSLTDKGIRSLKPRAKAYAKPDPEMRGHWVRIWPSGTKSFYAVTRNPGGKQIWTKTEATLIANSREEARGIIERVRAGLPPREPKDSAFGTIVENWRARHLVANGVRSAKEINRLLDRYILPLWRYRELIKIRKSDISTLLDQIADGHGAHTADACLTVMHNLMVWYSARHDSYAPPIIKGLRRTLPSQIARTRVLSDDELRAIWDLAGASGTFGAIIRMALLTAQRSRKIAAMKWADIEGDVWTIASEFPREKGTGIKLTLPPLALTVIEGQPRVATNEYIFAGCGERPFSNWTGGKAALDRKLPPGIPQWQIHDLRRTARSLMSRATILSEHAERVMGHSIPGIEGIYDRYDYGREKDDALAKLAALIESIVYSRDDNVLPLRGRK